MCMCRCRCSAMYMAYKRSAHAVQVHVHVIQRICIHACCSRACAGACICHPADMYACVCHAICAASFPLLGPIVTCITRHGGDIVKFAGDALLVQFTTTAVFSASFSATSPHPQLREVSTAITHNTHKHAQQHAGTSTDTGAARYECFEQTDRDRCADTRHGCVMMLP